MSLVTLARRRNSYGDLCRRERDILPQASRADAEVLDAHQLSTPEQQFPMC